MFAVQSTQRRLSPGDRNPFAVSERYDAQKCVIMNEWLGRGTEKSCEFQWLLVVAFCNLLNHDICSC
jgi:hypothetical protein